MIGNTTDITCAGAFLDSGGQGASGYSDNEDYTYTLCPDNPGDAISVSFLTFNLSTAGVAPMDNLSVYDGDDATAPLIGNYTGMSLQGQVVSASMGNPTGCLTFVWHSNATGTGIFAGTISCFVPCARPIASAVMGQPAPARICAGEVVNFDASASTAAAGFSIASYNWDFGDGTTQTTASPLVSHAYPNPGGYTTQLQVIDNNGCSSSNLTDLIVLVGTEPTFAGTGGDLTGCLGEQLCLTGVVNPTTWNELPEANFGSGVYLPDNVGSCFTSDLEFTQFAPGQTLTSVNQLASICIDIEHSFVGDLVISVIAPTGETVILHQQGGGGTYLGDANDFDSNANPVPGTCWRYCFTNTATNGTFANTTNFTGNSITPGDYESVQSLAGFVGAQLNGTWTIEICDLWGLDNGFLCEWELNFDPSLFADLIQFTPVYGQQCDSSSWSGPDIDGTSPDCNDICVTPTTVGNHVYTYTVADNFGCTYDTTLTITITPNADPGLDAALDICGPGPVIDLFGELGGTPDAGGSWTDPSGAPFGGNFDPATDPVGAYTYTVVGAAPCPNVSATVTINTATPPDPGIDGTIDLCSSDAAVNLFTSLGGTPDFGGAWTDAIGTPFSGTFDPTVDAAGVFTYTVAGTAPCTDESATVTVNVNTPPDPGVDGSIDLCTSDAAVNLFASLGGTPDAGGTWTDAGGAPFSGTFDPAVDAAGVFTYTVAGVAPCLDANATVMVNVNTPPDPGTDGSIDLCTSDAAVNLFASLSGTPDAGGTWTDVGGALFSGTFDPAVDAAGVFTYTVTGVAPCPDESATVTVNVNIPPDPGTNGSIDLCSSDAAVNLFASLGGTPDAGGTWTDGSGASFSGTFDPTVDAAGVFTYTVTGVAPCPDESATVTVNVNIPPDPGTDGTIDLCSSGAAVNLFASLGGTPDAGGVWTDATGAPFSGMFDPAVDAAGVFTYWVVGTTPCPDEGATVTVNVNTPPDPGTNGSIDLCSSDAAVNLFASLGGTPNVGGTWSDASGSPFSGTFDPAVDVAGVFTYTVAGVASCPDESATVTVHVNTPPDPGTDSSIDLCSSDAVVNLFASLAGTPDAGGVWTDASGSVVSGAFDPSVDAAGVFTYTVTGVAPCPDESATVTVNVNTPPDPGTDGSIGLCSSNASVNLFASLGGTPDAGGTWTDASGAASSGTFDPAVNAAGVYTYAVTGVAPCPDESSTVMVNVNTPPDPGTNGAIALCNSGPPADLFMELGGTPELGGTWTDPNGTPFSGIFTPGIDPVGVYMYTVLGAPPCPNVSAVVDVLVTSSPDPGLDGSTTVCTSDPAFGLFLHLGGTPDGGGVWTGPSGNAFSGNFDPAIDPAGVYTYTITVPPPCVSVSSIVTVNTIAPPNAGQGSALTLCISSPVTNLFGSLLGIPDVSGTWAGPGGSSHSGSFDPAIDASGNYIYTVAGNVPCPDASAVVSVSVVNIPDPGLDGSLDICLTDMSADLFLQLGGTPDGGGAWTDPNGSAVTGVFDPANDPAGVYTYTITVPPPCVSVSSTVTVNTITPPNAGQDGSLTLCVSSPATGLFSSLLGTPDAGGFWTSPNGTPHGGSFDPAIDTPGNYTYTVNGTSPCLDSSAVIMVSVVSIPDPGLDGTLDLCLTDAPADLFLHLGGTPDAGGGWTDPNGNAFTGIFDPASDQAGVYTYTITVPPPCVSVSSTVTINTIPPPYAGQDGSITLCVSSPVTGLFGSLLGAPDVGGFWIAPGGVPHSGSFDPATDPPGSYTYTVTGTAPCLNASAVVTVLVVSIPDPGLDGSLDLCQTDAPVGLFAQLGGTPDAGGSWTGPNGNVFAGTFDPANDPAGAYTYTITVPPPCVSVSSTVTVNTAAPPDAGQDGPLTLCISSPTTALFGSLQGTPDVGGSWTTPGGATHGGSFDPVTDPPGNYTYTVTGTAPCSDASAVVSVSVVSIPDPGLDGSLDLCLIDAPTDLFMQLGGTPDAGGSWTDPNGNAFAGTFDPANHPAGVYTYTIMVPPPCSSVSSTVTVNSVSPPSAGQDGSLTLCVSSPATNLFNSLLGNPDVGGTWIAPVGAPHSGMFDPAIDIPGNYTYTVAGNSPCPDATAVVTVSVVSIPDPGQDGSLDLCLTDAPTDLFLQLGGTPDTGGSWTDPNGNAFAGTFDPANDPAGVYTYTIIVPPPCASVSSTVTVNTAAPPDAGIDAVLAPCASGVLINLFTALGGTPDPGGTWTDPTGALFSGTFDPANDPIGVYTYTVAGIVPCPNAMATASVTIVNVPNAGTDGILNLCFTGPLASLFPELGGTPDPGGIWTDPNGQPSTGMVDPNSSIPGDYTYTVAGQPPCPSSSAVVTLNILQEPDAGVDGTAAACATDLPFDLFSALNGSPDAGGDWSTPGGIAHSGIIDPASDPAGTYMYVISAPPPCVSDTSFVDVSISAPVNAGVDTTILVCENSAAFDLLPLLGSTADSAGSWSSPGGIAHSGWFDPMTDAAGAYSYMVQGNTPCPNDVATINVMVEGLPNAGIDGSTIVCPGSPAFALFPLLGGTPDTGGVWTDPNGVAFNGIYDPGSDPVGGYTYTVNFTATCPNAMATATVNIYNVIPPDAGDDTVSCDLSATLNATGSWSSGVWTGPPGALIADPNSASTSLAATAGGAYTFYWSVITLDGCATIDSVTVVFTDPISPQVMTEDALCWSYCDGEAEATVTGGNMGDQGPLFTWTGVVAGQNDSAVVNLCAGSYSVAVADTNGCNADTSFQILEPPQLQIDQLIAVDETCPGDCDGSIEVIDPAGAQFSIDGGSTITSDPVISDLCPGSYTVLMTDANGCAALGTTDIGSPPQVVASFIPSHDTLLVSDTYLDLLNTSEHATQFVWDLDGVGFGTDMHTNLILPDGLGDTYEVCLTAYDDNLCTDVFCAPIVILELLQVWVPNAFTPNGDPHNQSFGPVFNGGWITEYEFLIFDRWGELLFGSDTPGELWNGTYKGTPVQHGVYVWRLVFEDQRSNKKEQMMGHVTVVR